MTAQLPKMLPHLVSNCRIASASSWNSGICCCFTITCTNAFVCSSKFTLILDHKRLRTFTSLGHLNVFGSGVGTYQIFDSYSLRCRIVVRIVYSYSDKQCRQNEYKQLVCTCIVGLWSKRRQVKTATSQRRQKWIVKTSTNPNNTYSSSDAYIIDRWLYTYIWHATVELYKKSTIFHRAQCLTLVQNRSEPVIFY